MSESDIALLRAYEPVIAFTQGELFFPTDVEGYVRCCSLHHRGSDGGSEQLVAAGDLTLDLLLDQADAHADADLFLMLVDQPLSRREVRRRHRLSRPEIARTGRLAAVGVAARLVDLAMRASLMVRGSVPGGVVAAAAERYRELMKPERYVSYGRVVRDGGYVILQYWYFYAMNDWRSTFGGINDHEADWEMVTVYLAERELRPEWVAFSSHDYVGDDLRRRWDDPDLRRAGDHPIVFAGAGSHSGAVVPGDYLVRVDPPRIRRLVGLLQRGARLIAPWMRGTPISGIGIPFIDYARGNGITVGPGGDQVWDLVPIDDDTPWVRRYRGLWGRDTKDRFGGERAPAGPRYERDGRVRGSWADPLGWAGLQKVSPGPEADAAVLTERITRLDEEISAADGEITARRAELRALRAEATSLDRHANTRAQAREHTMRLSAAEKALAGAYAERSRLREQRAAHCDSLLRPPAPDPPQAHLRHTPVPYELTQRRRTRLLSVWAAVSTPLFLIGLSAILLIPGYGFIPGVFALAFVFLTIEAIARRRLLAFLVGLILLCAGAAVVVSVLLALWENWRITVAVPLAVVALLLLAVNLRDLTRR